MRIIQPGKLASTKEYYGKCPSCGTVFIFEEHEAKKNYPLGGGMKLEIMCPLPGCNRLVTSDSQRDKVIQNKT